jgi:hypothetical protein
MPFIDNYNLTLAMNAMRLNPRPFTGILPRTYNTPSGWTLAIVITPDAQETDAPDNGASLARAMTAAWERWPTIAEWTIISTNTEPSPSVPPVQNFINSLIVCQFNSTAQ